MRRSCSLILGTMVLGFGFFTAEVAAQERQSIRGVWEGQYTCAQGLTGLRLTIGSQSGSDVSALFHFYAVPSNQDVPSGYFKMEGVYNESSGTLTLVGTEWLSRPQNYFVVDLDGMLNRKLSRYSGAVTSQIAPSCTTFDLTKHGSYVPPDDIGNAVCGRIDKRRQFIEDEIQELASEFRDITSEYRKISDDSELNDCIVDAWAEFVNIFAIDYIQSKISLKFNKTLGRIMTRGTKKKLIDKIAKGVDRVTPSSFGDQLRKSLDMCYSAYSIDRKRFFIKRAEQAKFDLEILRYALNETYSQAELAGCNENK